MLGGGGGLASLAGGLLGGSSGATGGGASPLSAMVPAISQFVAQKTGLEPAVAQTVVSIALPKVIELVKQHDGGSLLGSLL